MRTRKSLSGPYLIAVLFILGVVVAFATPRVHAETLSSTTVQQHIAQAFQSVRDAENAGGNVTSLISELNEAINLTEAANTTANSTLASGLLLQADALASRAISDSPKVTSQGIAARNLQIVLAATDIGIGAIGVVLAYRFVPRVYWRLWLRTHELWRAARAK